MGGAEEAWCRSWDLHRHLVSSIREAMPARTQASHAHFQPSLRYLRGDSPECREGETGVKVHTLDSQLFTDRLDWKPQYQMSE